jgi:N-acetyl-anhydromuramyl-L-alanine amidase AmpD
MSYVRPDVNGLSRLSSVATLPRTDATDRTAPVYGVVVHTTGSSIVDKALKNRQTPLDAALAYYRTSPYFAHYVIGYGGETAQVADEHEKAMHVGWGQEARGAFLSGRWMDTLPRAYCDAWHARWPAYVSPAHLFPGESVNNVTVGVELLPWRPGCPMIHQPEGALRYSKAQHVAVARLAEDIATRWGFPPGWSRTGRLAGHEDLNPLERVTKSGLGWDPGVIRPEPWIDWQFILSQLERPVVA